MCEVAVCKGDDGGHARTCRCVSRCECHGKVCERRNTQMCVCGMELERESAMETTASDNGQRPSSGRSCNGNRAGLAQQQARGSGRAAHETATCSPAGVKPGPGTPAVDVSLSRGRTKGRLGRWIRNGWVLQAGACVKLDVACAGCSVRRAHGAGYGRAEHMCSWGEPLGVRGLLLGMRNMTSWLHVWLGSGRRE